MPSEEAVEQAAKIIHQNFVDSNWDEADYGERLWAMGTARAVFAQIPTPALGFVIATRGDVRVVQYDNNVWCHPASTEEAALWDAFRAAQREILSLKAERTLLRSIITQNSYSLPVEPIDHRPRAGTTTAAIDAHDHDHKPVQHRDGKPPWCPICRLDAAGNVPVSFIGTKRGSA